MKVAITGTPGTGKTSVSERLEGFRTVHLTDFVRERGLGAGNEPIEVDVDAMRESLSELEGDLVFEGHLAHRAEVDYCVVLRCEPEKLRERLSKRDYDQEKIEENLEAEALDQILQEAVAFNQKVFEVDTTGRSVEETAELIREAIEERKEEVGKVNWTDWL
ncbi:MAG: adenylate kinase family protein [Candidatus Nanohaloarchaea archaeon]